MKILIVNACDKTGGAARAAMRLHKSLLQQGVDSNMLVKTRQSTTKKVFGPEGKLEQLAALLRPMLDSLPTRLYTQRSKQDYSVGWAPGDIFARKINEINPDVVHLHWINDGMLRIDSLAAIKAPIVWTLHDMWPFTGGCHYDEECGKYMTECGQCPALGSNRKKDLSNLIFQKKAKVFKTRKFTLIGLSRWLTSCIKNSALLGKHTIVNLPNPIDTNNFKPVDKKLAREMLGLPTNKKLVLFGAMQATEIPRKGFKQLSEALFALKADQIELIVFGSERPAKPPDFKFPTNYLGTFQDDLSLKILYSAADVMVLPSIQENLSNAVMESLACGTPVAAFDIGGNSDMIEHCRNGYLAKPYSSEDLAKGIAWIIENSKPLELEQNARKKVLTEFDFPIVANQYIKLYREILSKSRAP